MTPLNITEFPNELILRILYELYATKTSILHFISTCKTLYRDFEFLLYIVSPTKLVEGYSDKSKDIRSAKFIERLLRDDGAKIMNKLVLLDAAFVSRYQRTAVLDAGLERLVVRNMIERQDVFQKLKILNLRMNSLPIFHKLMNSLPKTLVSLTVTLDRISNRDFKGSYSALKNSLLPCPRSLIEDTVTKLECFTLSFHNSIPVTTRTIHPVLGHYPDTNLTQSEETRNLQNSNSRLIKTYHAIQDQITKSNRCKLLIGCQLNEFLHLNKNSLKKVEMLGIDLNLVFQSKLPVPCFSKLRLFSFDNTSRASMHCWLSRLQRENQSPTFDDRLPILILFDSMAERLYQKSFGKLKTLDSVPEMSLWTFSDEYRSYYAMLNIERGILY
ncbi:hypothetical protein WICPIJ_010007 [Wickerhamomyces pijperi]|uniref:Uncharacterized protein n=1 Tax=Wickerhamomyces pijperi TaxID=599730 RepID=A0A9P8PII5_WICPI|nr:hypothetical protein WICPIJ_010007 [Wickerhamomyces pijperi]